MKITNNVKLAMTESETSKVSSLQTSGDGNGPDRDPTPSLRDKIKLAVLGVIMVSVIIGGIFFISSAMSGKDDGPKEPESGEVSNPTDEDPVNPGDQPSNPQDVPDAEEKPSVDTAKDNLKKPDAPLEDSSLEKEALEGAFDYLEKLDPTEPFDPLASRGLNKTPMNIIDNIRLVINLGYKVDVSQSEWFYSSRENVYQFVVPMFKEGDNAIVLSGNYINTVGEINIAKFEGDPDVSDLTSPDGGPQS